MKLSKKADVYVYGYNHTRALVTNGHILADEIRELTASRIDLVGYNMRGLVARLKTNENQSVNWVESELTRCPSPKHIDLLPQYQNLGLKRSSRPEEIREQPDSCTAAMSRFTRLPQRSTEIGIDLSQRADA